MTVTVNSLDLILVPGPFWRIGLGNTKFGIGSHARRQTAAALGFLFEEVAFLFAHGYQLLYIFSQTLAGDGGFVGEAGEEVSYGGVLVAADAIGKREHLAFEGLETEVDVEGEGHAFGLAGESGNDLGCVVDLGEDGLLLGGVGLGNAGPFLRLDLVEEGGEASGLADEVSELLADFPFGGQASGGGRLGGQRGRAQAHQKKQSAGYHVHSFSRLQEH